MQTKEAQEYAEKLDAIREKKDMEAYSKALDIISDNVESCIREFARLALKSENEKIRSDNCLKIAYMAGLKPKEADNIGKTRKLVIEEKPKKVVESA